MSCDLAGEVRDLRARLAALTHRVGTADAATAACTALGNVPPMEHETEYYRHHPHPGAAAAGRTQPPRIPGRFRADRGDPVVVGARVREVAAMIETDLELDCARVLHVYDSGADAGHPLTVFWHHGTPNIGAPPRPLLPASDRLGIRWVAHDRPGYGGSTPAPGRTVATAAADVAAVADAMGIDRFAVMGHSGGSAHALACGALLPDRVRAVVGMSGLAPYLAEGLDWFAGMAEGGVASLSAAAEGREAKQRYEASQHAADPGFTTADQVALEGEWSWFVDVVRPALTAGPGPLIDDDLAHVAPWGFDPAEVSAPVLLVHGQDDRVVPSAHSAWLAARCPSAELWLRPGEGHISVMSAAEDALDWLVAHVQPR